MSTGVAFTPFFAWIAAIMLYVAYREFRRRCMERDPAGVVYAKAVELLEARPCEWTAASDGLWTRTLRLEPARLTVRRVYVIGGGGYRYSVCVDGAAVVDAGTFWTRRLGRAWNVATEAQTKASHLNAICDTIERLGESNVIPLRRNGDAA